MSKLTEAELQWANELVEKEKTDLTNELLAELTWENARKVLNKFGQKYGEWAGIPIPVERLSLIMEPRYPWKVDGMRVRDDGEKSTIEFAQEKEELNCINYWYSEKQQQSVWIYKDEITGKARAIVMPEWGASRFDMWLNTLNASQAWALETEEKALEKLKSLVTEVAYKYYVLTGTFLETSKKSNVIYLFRKLRPTIAMGRTPENTVKLLCTLCMHPLGYYEHSWAGVHCPTDDVICALMLMRGDEHFFWKKSNQHPFYIPPAGV